MTITTTTNIFLTVKRVLVTSPIGNLLEMYLFSLFVIFLPTLAPIFFPDSDPLAALLSAYVVFSAAFLAYPLGLSSLGMLGIDMGGV